MLRAPCLAWNYIHKIFHPAQASLCISVLNRRGLKWDWIPRTVSENLEINLLLLLDIIFNELLNFVLMIQNWNVALA